MRVLLARLTDAPGGVARHVNDLAAGLERRGYEVDVAVPSDRSPRSLVGSLRRGTDVLHVHLHDTYDRAALPLLMKSVALRIPRVLTEHLPRTNASDPTLLPGRRRPASRYTKTAFKTLEFGLVDRVIVVGRSSSAFLNTRYGVSPDRTVVVPNGIPAPTNPLPAPISARPMRVVSPGAVIVQKGHDVLVEAASRSSGRWTARILGSGPHDDRLRASIEARAAGRVEVAGWSENVEEEILRADVVCIPSRWEALPYAALEAMALSRPVVASDVDGLSDLLSGGSGVLVPADDPSALAAALDALETDAGRRRRLGLTGWRRVRDEFSLAQMLDGVEAVYRGLSTSRTRSA